jgi:hypothetical protein
MDNEPKKEIVMPIVFDFCPVCGSKVRLGATLIQQLKDSGELHKDAFPDGLMLQVPLVDRAHPPTVLSLTGMKVKVITAYWDICECGNMYCVKFNCIDAPVQTQPMPPPGNGGGFNMPRRF